MKYLLLMVMATVLVCGGCGDDGSDDTGGDADSDSDSDTDSDTDTDTDTGTGSYSQMWDCLICGE